VSSFNQGTDIIVVGAGSAGCTLAARLSEDPHLHITLIEAGTPSQYPWLDIPIGYFKTVGNPAHDWKFETQEEAGMADRRLPWPRGKGLGGSSLINGMLYLRGHRLDYDRWASLGNTGWSWDEVLPYFQRAMNTDRPLPGDGQGGPLWVSELPHDPLSDAFIAAAARSGIKTTADFNGGDNSGAGYFRMNTHRGQRMSTERAYLREAMKRPNLKVISGAHITQVLMQDQRAQGVAWVKDGNAHQLHANNEVVLCAGAIQSPQILQLSGIGPSALLAQHKISTVVDLPGVGENLQDHLQVRPSYRCEGVETLNDVANSQWRSARDYLRYQLTRTGPLATGVYRAGAFLSLDNSAQTDWPNVQIHFGLVSFDRPHQPPHPFPGVTLSACMLRPDSRGRIQIGSADPLARPNIHAGYLSAESDQRLAIQMVRKMREIASQAPLSSFIVQEHEPGESQQSDAEILDWVRRRAGSIFHPVGTCSMGLHTDPLSVVDSRLRVHGVQGLRVVDGSVMPHIVSGNTNAPIIMLAEKAADLIRQDLQA
jgi:choline dehydrogenase